MLTRMLSDESAFQSYVHIHLDRLCAIVLRNVIHEYFVFVVLTVSACIYMRATVEISSMLDEAVV